MRFERVLLISPYYGGIYSATLPAGLGYIAESLERHEIEYDVLDLQLGYDQREVRRLIREFRPDLVGFSVITYRYLEVYRLSQRIKEWLPDVQIVIGGPFASTFREQVLQDCGAIDYCIVLEGDETIVELCQGKDLPSIGGLIYCHNGEVLYTGDRPFLTDLDTIPFPRYRRFSLDKYTTGIISIVSSRGCPYNCIYCPVKLSIGRKLRIRSSKFVVDELEYWHQKGYRRFGFADDNFTFYAERVHEICDEIEIRSLRALELILGNGIRADRVDRSLLVRMKEVGFRHIAFGVESASNRILKCLHKSETVEQIEETIANACQLGIDVKLHFIIGSPGETLSSVKDSIAFAMRYPIGDVSFNNLIPYPGTELFAWLSSEGLLLYPTKMYLNDFSPSSREPIFATPEFSLEDRKRAFKIADVARRKIRQNYYERKLKKLNFLAKTAARVFASGFVQNRVLFNRSFQKWANRIGNMLYADKP